MEWIIGIVCLIVGAAAAWFLKPTSTSDATALAECREAFADITAKFNTCSKEKTALDLALQKCRAETATTQAALDDVNIELAACQSVRDEFNKVITAQNGDLLELRKRIKELEARPPGGDGAVGKQKLATLHAAAFGPVGIALDPLFDDVWAWAGLEPKGAP